MEDASRALHLWDRRDTLRRKEGSVGFGGVERRVWWEAWEAPCRWCGDGESAGSWCLMVSGLVSSYYLARSLSEGFTTPRHFRKPQVTGSRRCVIFFGFHICHCVYDSLQLHWCSNISSQMNQELVQELGIHCDVMPAIVRIVLTRTSFAFMISTAVLIAYVNHAIPVSRTDDCDDRI